MLKGKAKKQKKPNSNSVHVKCMCSDWISSWAWIKSKVMLWGVNHFQECMLHSVWLIGLRRAYCLMHGAGWLLFSVFWGGGKNEESPAAFIRLSMGRAVPLHPQDFLLWRSGCLPVPVKAVWESCWLCCNTGESAEGRGGGGWGLGSPGQWKVSFTLAGWGGIVGCAGQASSADPQVEGIHQWDSPALIQAADWSSRRRSWGVWRVNPCGPDPAGSRSLELTSSWDAPLALSGSLGLQWRGEWMGRCWARCGCWMAGESLWWRWLEGRCQSSGWWLPVWHARTLGLPPWSCLLGWMHYRIRNRARALTVCGDEGRFIISFYKRCWLWLLFIK